MTLRGFLTWYLGAIVFVGTAGASGYQVLSRQQAEQAAAKAPDAAAVPMAVAAAPPAETAPPAAAGGAAPSTPYNIADATKPPQPPQSQAEKAPAVHAPKWVKPVERRPMTAARRPVAPPPRVAVAAPAPSGWVYAQVPAPTYYAYPGYPAYRPGYVYYYPRYQYYRAY
jgi:hypothetical protein